MDDQSAAKILLKLTWKKAKARVYPEERCMVMGKFISSPSNPVCSLYMRVAFALSLKYPNIFSCPNTLI